MLGKSKRKFFALCLVMLATACAQPKDFYDYDLQLAAKTNPATGPAVKIVEVVDKRVFEVKPRKASTPSIRNPEHLKNPDLVARTVSRQRAMFGRALANIALPEGRTMVQEVQKILQNGLIESGYRVLHKGDPGYANAPALRADVNKFWFWFTPGVTVTHHIEIALLGDWPLKAPNQPGTIVQGEDSYFSAWAIGFKDIDRVIGNSANMLNESLKAKLKKPGS